MTPGQPAQPHFRRFCLRFCQGWKPAFQLPVDAARTPFRETGLHK
jgi:hypothetical protein